MSATIDAYNDTARLLSLALERIAVLEEASPRWVQSSGRLGLLVGARSVVARVYPDGKLWRIEWMGGRYGDARRACLAAQRQLGLPADRLLVGGASPAWLRESA